MEQKVKFTNKGKTDFYRIVKERVDRYFKEKNISRHANWQMILKTIAMLCIFFIPYGLILSGLFGPWLMLLLVCLLGIGTAGIGMSVMHDANHGGYSSNKTVNTIIGYLVNIIGGNAFTWKIQHNILHHTYTNVYHHDEDIEPQGAMRFTPSAPLKPIFRYQHIYATFLYGMMTLLWALHKDFKQLFRYKKQGLISGAGGVMTKEISIIIVTKIVYYGYLLVIPVMILDITFWQWAVAFVVLHFIAGAILGFVFQMAHVVEKTAFPVPTSKGNIENEWAIHQMHTTANFARRNRLVSWYLGGLNFQVEHHLFPKICHIHYGSISPIVKKTAEEFNIPYNDHPTFFAAIKSHFRLIKALGRGEEAKLIAAN